MCASCGCSGHEHTHDQEDEHGLAHEHAHAHAHATSIKLEERILAKNERYAQRNRDWLEGRNVLTLNLMSSPGAGKTTLLERTIRALRGELEVGVVEGDQETSFDAERLRATGCRTLQINTGTGCHLEAQMFGEALKGLNPPPRSVVMIENVGNLVCPALFDLGEHARIVILSVTEGDDKPLKYPHMFRSCQLMLVNKVDLLGYVQFDVERCVERARQINPAIASLTVSATTGEGMDDWYEWLRRQHRLQCGPAAFGSVQSGV